jgi:lipid-A-disaccharide synthase
MNRRLEVTLALLGELGRVFAMPLFLLVYLWSQRRWKTIARAAVETGGPAEGADPFHGLDRARDALVDARPPRAGVARRHVFVSCGEASGVGHALHLARAILESCAKAGSPLPRFTVFGNDELARALPDSRLAYPLAEHPQVGIGGVLKNIGFFVRAHATFVDVLRDDPPDVVLLVDYPGMHSVMAGAARRRRIPVVHYVAPQYWAWGPWRVARYRRAVDLSLTILPFEPAFFESLGLRSAYVGHPLVDALAHEPPDPSILADARREPLLAVLPGARRLELDWHLPGMLGIVASLRARRGPLRCVLVQRDARAADRTRAALAALPADAAGGPIEIVTGPPGPWLAGARAVLAKSGTASLEAALHGNPLVVVYRVAGRFYRFVYHNLLTVPYFAAANLVAGREVVPEFAVLEDRDWQRAADALDRLWQEGDVRKKAIEDLVRMRVRLGPGGASERAARVLLPYCIASGPAVEAKGRDDLRSSNEATGSRAR